MSASGERARVCRKGTAVKNDKNGRGRARVRVIVSRHERSGGVKITGAKGKAKCGRWLWSCGLQASENREARKEWYSESLADMSAR